MARMIREGVVLTLDPSSGSQGSQPGYALRVEGQVVDSGLISIGHGKWTSHRKYRELRRTLMEEFDSVDLLIVEDIPPVRIRKGGGGVVGSHAKLIESVGVIIASVECKELLRIHPQTWRSFLTDGAAYNLIKTDEYDALVMDYAASAVAEWVQHNPRKPKRRRKSQ